MNDKGIRRGWKWWAAIGAAVVIFGALIAVATLYYPRWRQHRLVERAKAFALWKDYTSASLTARRVLQQDGRNVAALRVMAEIAEAAGLSATVTWRSRIVQVEPKVENYLDLASSALAFGKTDLARDTLNSSPAEVKKSARYHDLVGRAALASNLKAEAEAAFAEAARLEPANREYALNLAARRLESPSVEIRNEARKGMESFLLEAVYFRRSSRLLIDDALRQSDRSRALSLADTLRRDPQAPLEDRLTYLSLLHQLDRQKFPGYLAELQEEAAPDKNKLYTLVSWLNTNGCALIALEWSKRLPTAAVSEMPVPVALAQSYVVLGDWSGLKPIVTEQSKEQLAGSVGSGDVKRSIGQEGNGSSDWQGYEFMRLALLARSLRGVGQVQESSVSWNEAVQAVVGRPEALQVLARAALDWKWESESTTVLWLLADRGGEGAQWALDQLFRRYLAASSARNLLRVVSRMSELDPANEWAKNNIAALSFLLNTNMEQALKLASELYAKDPANPGYVSTYAFGLHLRGRSSEGMEVMRTLGQTKLNDPAFAAYYGIILSAVNSPEARKYLALARNAPLLPEELKLVEDTAKRLDGGAGVSPSAPPK